MNRLEERNQKFMKFWNKWRQRKWQYVTLCGGVGLAVIIPGYFWAIEFKLANIEVAKFVTQTLMSGASGVWYGLWSYKKQEKMYQELLAANDAEQA
ncbi:hypothetical protein [Pontibacter beigongshangensis]|uniref:hypothetical protein n=1 Tax=Pontibacter beigongshangensis TaxID=2574733 RepID=UPI00164F3D9D|nr:hypothetical protein [Pontibacter beigongshangensis]